MRHWFGLLFVMAMGCGSEPLPEVDDGPRPVKLYDLDGAESKARVEYPGTITASVEATLAFEIAGKLEKVPVTEGQVVKKGELLASIDPRDAQAMLDGAQADVVAAKAEYQRMQSSFAADAASRQDLDVARRNYEVAAASYRAKRKTSDDTEIYAPFDGVVARKFVDDYENVAAKQAIVLLQDDGGLEIRVEVPERDAVRASPNISAAERTSLISPVVELAALPGQSFPATITEFATSADPVTRTYTATFTFDKPDGVNILPGMTARIAFDVSKVSGELVAVPVQAVTSDPAGQSFVWVVDDQMLAHRVDVTLGTVADDYVIVLDGLEGSEVLATSGVQVLREGQAVRKFEG